MSFLQFCSTLFDWLPRHFVFLPAPLLFLVLIDQSYFSFYTELKDSDLYDPLCKFWVFMSCTRYKPPHTEEGFDHYSKIPHYIKGHTALGGGNMALFGTGCLHTWAKNLEELVERFSDDRKIDRKILFDDSGYR